MCSICGMADFVTNENLDPKALTIMGKTMKHRGPDDTGVFLSTNVLLHHNRLSVIDIDNGKQPMTVTHGGRKYALVYNGEIYNTDELREKLTSKGAVFATKCDTEVVLWSYIMWGERCVDYLNGIFAFAVYDEAEHRLFAARDRFGVKPFFYTFVDSTLLFASEIKALLSHRNVKPKVDKPGLWQLFYLAPVTFNGTTVFRDIFELKPGERAVFDKDGLKTEKYWSLKAKPFNDSREEAIYKTNLLMKNAIKRQLVSDVPLCEFLSGGLDSSVITAVASKVKREHGEKTDTYSFEYEGNKENFKSSLFQPQGDDEYAAGLAEFLCTNHTVLTAPTERVAKCLFDAVDARDFPGQADIDSSLLYYCSLVKKHHTVAISGECSDEIFGGYPWFYRKEMLERDFFPWIHDPFVRVNLFKEEAVLPKDGYEYISEKYRQDIADCSLLESDSEEMRQSRIATKLSTDFFMTSLLERKDRMSMASGVEVRVPFADHTIAEYVYNVPWDIKFHNQTEKALLRDAMYDFLPERIIHRKKSPYPKSHNPEYEKIVTEMLRKECRKKNTLFSSIADTDKINEMLSGNEQTWFGQLMAKPQLIAWLVQFSYWCEKYNIVLV